MPEPDTRPGGLPVQLSAPEAPQVDQTARTISGMVVPFGPAGRTAAGALTFAAGSLRWTDPKRVKLLLEHDQRQPIGYATALEERPDGLWATFTVPEGDAGTVALAEAALGLRDGLSVGSQLDDTTAHRLRKAQANGGSVEASGHLREVSLVSVPAFDDARVASVAASASLVVSAWSDDPNPNPEPDREDPTMTDQATTQDSQVTTTDQAAQEPRPVVRAAAGAALVTSQAPTYNFAATQGHSLVADMANAGRDAEAAGRVARFHAELADGNQGTQAAMADALRPLLATAAVLTRDPVPDSAFLAPSVRPVLDRAADQQRVLVPLTTQLPLANGQPFVVPIIGKFTGVGLHTEGTPHVAEGTQELGGETVTPKAVSGAYRMSREVAEQSTPVMDALVLQKMVADYGANSERVAIAAVVAAVATATAGVSTVMDLRAELLATMATSNIRPSAVVVGIDYLTTLASDADTTGRPFFSTAPAVNSPAQLGAGFTNASVDGTPLVSSRDIATGEGIIIRKDAMLFGEAPVQTFRLEQPEGPGIIKLAVWGYVAAKVIDATGVRRVTA